MTITMSYDDLEKIKDQGGKNVQFYRQGFNDGHEIGYKEGYKDGSYASKKQDIKETPVINEEEEYEKDAGLNEYEEDGIISGGFVLG